MCVCIITYFLSDNLRYWLLQRMLPASSFFLSLFIYLSIQTYTPHTPSQPCVCVFRQNATQDAKVVVMLSLQLIKGLAWSNQSGNRVCLCVSVCVHLVRYPLEDSWL